MLTLYKLNFIVDISNAFLTLKALYKSFWIFTRRHFLKETNVSGLLVCPIFTHRTPTPI